MLENNSLMDAALWEPDTDFRTDMVRQAYADEIGAMFIETSAKDDLNVQKIFIDLSKSDRSVKHFQIQLVDHSSSCKMLGKVTAWDVDA
jgi:hypothetical protein